MSLAPSRRPSATRLVGYAGMLALPLLAGCYYPDTYYSDNGYGYPGYGSAYPYPYPYGYGYAYGYGYPGYGFGYGCD